MHGTQNAPMLLAPLVLGLHLAMLWVLSLHVQEQAECRTVRAGHGGVMAVISLSAAAALGAIVFASGGAPTGLWGFLLLPVVAGMVGCTTSLGLVLKLRPRRPLLPLLLCSAAAHLSTSLLIYALVMPVMAAING